MYPKLIKSIEEFLTIVKTRVISGSDIKIIDFWVWNTQPEKLNATIYLLILFLLKNLT